MKKKSILITAPSGAGKTTLVKKLLIDFPHLEFSISAATREPRDHEKNGIDYHFITEKEFRSKIEENNFLECISNGYSDLLGCKVGVEL